MKNKIRVLSIVISGILVLSACSRTDEQQQMKSSQKTLTSDQKKQAISTFLSSLKLDGKIEGLTQDIIRRTADASKEDIKKKLAGLDKTTLTQHITQMLDAKLDPELMATLQDVVNKIGTEKLEKISVAMSSINGVIMGDLMRLAYAQGMGNPFSNAGGPAGPNAAANPQQNNQVGAAPPQVKQAPPMPQQLKK